MFDKHGVELKATELVETPGFPGSADSASSKAALLVMEPDGLRLHERRLFLSEAGYNITTVSNLRDLAYLSASTGFASVLLSDYVGCFALRAAAQLSRQRWPLAKILIWGVAATVLDDNLYDVATRQSAKPQEVLDVLLKLLEDEWSQRSGRSTSTYVSSGGSPSWTHVHISESDPTKIKKLGEAGWPQSGQMPGGQKRIDR